MKQDVLIVGGGIECGLNAENVLAHLN